MWGLVLVYWNSICNFIFVVQQKVMEVGKDLTAHKVKLASKREKEKQ